MPYYVSSYSNLKSKYIKTKIYIMRDLNILLIKFVNIWDDFVRITQNL
jgi:hypothetical protein